MAWAFFWIPYWYLTFKQLVMVAFCCQLMELPVDIKKCLKTLCLKLSNNKYTVVINLYTPMLDADIKYQFYSSLNHILTNACQEDKIILLNYFNDPEL